MLSVGAGIFSEADHFKASEEVYTYPLPGENSRTNLPLPYVAERHGIFVTCFNDPQVTPSVEEATIPFIVPELPTIINLPLPYVIFFQSYSRNVVVVHVIPSTDAAMFPIQPTATNLPFA